jgi:salicylate hydroxylase
VLAQLLIDEPEAQVSFAKFVAKRRARVARVARTALGNGRIFHMPWPISVGRDLVIAAQGGQGHLQRLGWLYRYDPDDRAT